MFEHREPTARTASGTLAYPYPGRSTSRRPGDVEEVDQLRTAGGAATRATGRSVMALMAVDLPEFERPAKATSRPVIRGRVDEARPRLSGISHGDRSTRGGWTQRD